MQQNVCYFFFIMINFTLHHDIKGSLVNCTFNFFLLGMKKYSSFPLQVFYITVKLKMRRFRTFICLLDIWLIQNNINTN